MRLRMRLMRHRWKWASHASGRQISLDELADSLNGYKSTELLLAVMAMRGVRRERSGSDPGARGCSDSAP